MIWYYLSLSFDLSVFHINVQHQSGNGLSKYLLSFIFDKNVQHQCQLGSDMVPTKFEHICYV